MAFKAFEDDHSQVMLDELTLENQGDRVSIYGSIQITRDKVGLEQARQLLSVLQQMVDVLETEDLPDQLPESNDGDEVDNPFWQN